MNPEFARNSQGAVLLAHLAVKAQKAAVCAFEACDLRRIFIPEIFSSSAAITSIVRSKVKRFI